MLDGGLCWLEAGELAELIARRDVSPVEVVDAHLARIERLNPHLNAFITLLGESAREAAREAERKLMQGGPCGPLHGVPVVLKDIVYTRGVRTTMGSRIFSDFVPAYDAAVVERFRSAGAIVLGKAHTHEFAFGATSDNPHYGPCRNPWDRMCIPGGSSGGSAASVAAGLSPIAIGSDTGGSIRIPAALCGVVGIKPTYGRVSRFGVFPLSWALDHVGPLTRTVRDAALVLRTIAGIDPRDQTSSKSPVPDYTAALTDNLEGLRVGVLREHVTGPCDGEVRGLVMRAIQQLADLGAVVEEVSIPSVIYAAPVLTVIVDVEATAIHEPTLKERAGEYGPDVRPRFVPGVTLSGVDYVHAQQARTRIMLDVRAAMERCDVLVGPAVQFPATPIGEEVYPIGEKEVPIRASMGAFTRLHNLTGFPAMTVPCGYVASGLPVGLQISGRPLDEATVFRVGRAYEHATAGSRRRPPLEDLP